MKKYLAFICAASMILSLSACGGGKPSADTPGASSSGKASEEKTAEKTSAENTSVPTSSKEETTAEQEPVTEAADTSAPEPELYCSFGKPVDAFIAGINERTLANEGSGVFDVLGDLSALKAPGKVRELVESYSLPNKEYYGDSPAADELKEEIARERNFEALLEDSAPELRYAILTENADVRGFPTMIRATDTGSDEEFDFFQETRLNLGTGVIVLWDSLSGDYCFVQGYNYNGWVRKETLAFTDEKSFRDYLSMEEFLLCVKPDVADPLKRLGVTLRIEEQKDGLITYAVPGRDADGMLTKTLLTGTPEDLSVNYHVGFLSWSADACVELMRSLLGVPYGWGDRDDGYDCSSTVGLVYSCFGFVLPRNTGILKHFGVHSEDVEGKTYEELKDMILSHPSAILVMKGHAMMSCGVRKDENGEDYVSIVHNVVQWYTPEDGEMVRHLANRVSDTCPEETCKIDGTRYLDVLTRVIWVE